ncbi:MAG: CDP-diacylglycerol--glycerol-3-phosphate 3-phosphatidyltransferase [Termitinemataceae bacterium]|nr:MAG: CDP-diacylglycerol--glycerol-3-phosphate 3-phosphatidyltransferase [Termitinemataceae bacterium]
MRIADKLSLSRVFFAPVFVCLYLLFTKQNSFLGFVVLIVLLIFAELTDFFDGFVARKLKQVSDLGKLLDPFSDAILQTSIFLCFTITGTMFPIFFLLIMYREFAMLFIRMLCIKNGVAIGARFGGKIKTVLFITTCFFVLVMQAYQLSGWTFIPKISLFNIIKTVFFVMSVIASYVSFIDYLIHFRAALAAVTAAGDHQSKKIIVVRDKS